MTKLSDSTAPGSPLVVAVVPFEVAGFGWFCLSGLIAVRVADSVAAGPVYAAGSGGNAGQVTDTMRVGNRISGMTFVSSDVNGFADVQMDGATAREDA
jgi:hypothetical protein